MSKVKRKELVEKANEHELRLFQIEKALEQHGINWFTEEPKLKQLDQSIFDGLDEKWRWAAFNTPSNSPILFSVKPHESMYGKWYAVLDCDEYMTLDELEGVYEYTDNWQNSLIERDIAKELTGSDLCRAMLARGDYHVMCAVSDISESDAILSCNSAVITSGEIRGAFTNSFDGLHEHAVPINNQGEPLTASEAGL